MQVFASSSYWLRVLQILSCSAVLLTAQLARAEVLGTLDASSTGAINISLQITNGSRVLINPGNRIPNFPRFIAERLGQRLSQEGMVSFPLCVISDRPQNFRVNTRSIDGENFYLVGANGERVPFAVSIGLQDVRGSEARYRSVRETGCNERSALQISIGLAGLNTLADGEALRGKFELLFQPE